MFKEISKNIKIVDNHFSFMDSDIVITYHKQKHINQKIINFHINEMGKHENNFDVCLKYNNNKIRQIYLFYSENSITKMIGFKSIEKLDQYIRENYNDIFEKFKKQLINSL